MRRRRSSAPDALGRTVSGGTFVGAGLGGATLVFALLASLSGLSFGSCNFGVSNSTAPERDGLGIAVSPDGSSVVTVDSSAGLLDVIRDGRLSEQVPVGGQTTDVALTPDGRHALVTDTNVGGSSGIVSVIDLATATETARIAVGSGPTGVVVSPDGSRAYVADTGYLGLGRVDIVDLTRDTVSASLTVGRQPAGMAVSPDGSRLYVVDAALVPAGAFSALTGSSVSTAPATDAGDVDIVDTQSLQVVATVPVGVAPLLAALSPSGGTLAVGDYGSNALSLIDTATLAVRTVPVPNGSFGVAFSSDGSRVFVCGGNSPLVSSVGLGNVRSDKVSVVDVTKASVTASVRVAHDPTGVATNPSGSVYVALGDFPAVARIDPLTMAVDEIGVPGVAPVRSGDDASENARP